ncbi:BMP family ABC transporter substrate-binding protein [Schaalia sp. lx-100]|nr:MULTISPECIES: BMP family ABC transporter substrate-binding protein [unclassified Schaalia]MCD4549059.1 BMP family ABC transporter substrate-binding protein [Schaalia sp. lx-260]MCD4557247.1 BMP family ABC transporter substrate-binding protein [Schaalia sp. lx-100]
MKITAVAACAATSLLLAACGAAPDSTMSSKAAQSAGSASGNGNIKACMVSDSGGFEDKSFNESGKNGLEKAKAELGVDVAYSESQSVEDFASNISAQIQQNCNLIIGVGFLMAKAMDEAAQAHPEVKFALVDSTFENAKENAKALVFNTAEAAYLAGYAAAGMTGTGKVGTYLGMNIPTTAIFADGFADGIAKYNEDHGTKVELLGWDKEKQEGVAVGNFEDAPKGKQFTMQLIEQGADIILPVAGPVGNGTLAAAKENGNVSVVWVDADGYLTNADFGSFIMTSVMKEIGAAVFDTVKSLRDGKWDGSAYVGTIANGGVGIAPFHDFDAKIPAELKSEIDKLKTQIAEGKLKVESKNTPQ